MAALQYVDIPGYHAILIRDTFKNLTEPGALIFRSHEWLQGTDARWRADHWEFPSGASLSFGYLDGPRDHFNFQSAQFQFVGIDEATQVRQNQALYMFSRIRKLTGAAYEAELRRMPQHRHLKPSQIEAYRLAYESIPLRFRCASNPPTRENFSRGEWVKTRYVDALTRDKGAIFIPAWMSDNPHLDQVSYRKALSVLDPITRAQLEHGDWNVQIKGNLFERQWFQLVDAAPADAQRVRYWDLAATEKKSKDGEDKGPAWTAGCKMAVKDGIYYIEDMSRARKKPLGVEQLIRHIADMDGTDVSIGMEQEPGSGGVNTIDNYRRNVLPEFAVFENKKTTSKFEDAVPLSTQAEAGNIKIVKGHWNKAFLDEFELFPDGYKDQIDCTAGAFRTLAKPRVVRIRTI